MHEHSPVTDLTDISIGHHPSLTNSINNVSYITRLIGLLP